jgi:hypothetical protein
MCDVAGVLGLTQREVQVLENRASRDPCDALLNCWAERDPGATVRELVNKLRQLERLTLVNFIEAKIT